MTRSFFCTLRWNMLALPRCFSIIEFRSWIIPNFSVVRKLFLVRQAFLQAEWRTDVVN
jgi:hypothetical protein